MRRFCVRCGRQRRTTDWACPACGCDLYSDHVSGRAQVELAEPYKLRGPLQSLEMRGGGLLLLWGGPGSGKTTVALQALGAPEPSSSSSSSATALTSLTSPDVITSEMSPDLVLAYARRIGVQVSRIWAPTAELELETFGAELPADGRPIIYDSLTNGPEAVGVLGELQRYAEAHGVVVVAISQATKDGKFRGDRRLEHNADTVCELRDGRGIVTKNRRGPLGTFVFDLNELGAQTRVWDRYYSVEGTHPNYRVVPWPSGGRYAAPLRQHKTLADRGIELPPPPVAVSAEASDLYPGGFIEPPDVEQRRAYAEGLGLPFWRLHNGHTDRP